MKSGRKAVRLKDCDYSQEGYYFITVCVINRQNILCDVGVAAHGDPPIAYSIPQMTQTGQIVLQYLQNISTVYKNVTLDCFVIMPNHIHCIIALQNRPSPADNGSPWAATPTTTIPKIINSFKTLTSKKYGQSFWQRNYHEHIIRNENELQKIRHYIQNNPANWQKDKYFV